MRFLERLVEGITRGAANEAQKVVVDEVEAARATERGRGLLQSATLAAGVPYVAAARTPREALERLTVVADAAWKARGDRSRR